MIARNSVLKNQSGSPRTVTAVLSVALLLLVALTFARVATHGFLNYDDELYVTDNPNVNAGLSGEALGWALTSFRASNWHPLTWVSHMIDVQVYGLNPRGHHLTNLLFHALNACLLFIVLSRATGTVWRSWFVAAFFAVHPLHVESVAWVAERKDVLSTFFWAVTLLAYVRYARRPSLRSYAPVVAAFALGLLAKPMLVTLPFLLLLLDSWPLGRARGRGTGATSRGISWPHLVREKAPLFLLAAASSAVTYVAQKEGGSVVGGETFGWEDRFANAVVSYATYLRKLFVPFDLSAFYPHPGTATSLGTTLGAGMLLAGISLLFVRERQRRPYLPVGWLWYLGTLVPVIGFVQVGTQALADRYTYVPLVGLFVAISWGVADVGRTRTRVKGALLAAGVALLIAGVVSSRIQVAYWRDSRSLFEHAIALNDANPVAHSGLGVALARDGQLAQAAGHLATAARLAPGDPVIQDNLGWVLAERGLYEEAGAAFRRALAARPDYPRALFNSGVLMERSGKPAEAAAWYRKLLAVDPAYPDASLRLGVVLASLGDASGALEQYRAAVSRFPASAETHYRLGLAVAGLGRLSEAIASYREALRLDPALLGARYNLSSADNNLGIALAEAGKPGEAIAYFSEAARLMPENPSYANNLGLALASLGRLPEAVSQYREALRIKPDFAEARSNLEEALRR